jgi:hypothetical protein
LDGEDAAQGAALRAPEVRDALVAQSGRGHNGSLGRALAELGAAQSRLHTLDDDHYVRGLLAVRRYCSIRTRLEREAERLHAVVERASKQRIVLHPDPRQLWAEAASPAAARSVRLVVERAEAMPARRGARFDPSRLRLEIPLLSAVSTVGVESGPEGAL